MVKLRWLNLRLVKKKKKGATWIRSFLAGAEGEFLGRIRRKQSGNLNQIF